jgi:gentisate 1,2-dioxygenase
MENYIKAYEYESNVNPNLKSIPIISRNIKDCEYGLNFIDLSEKYNVLYKSTTPNLLASFIKLKKNYYILSENNEEKKDINATSHLFYVIEGKAEIVIENKTWTISKNDILVSPCLESIYIGNNENEELQIYYVNDSPLLNYLGSKANEKTFQTCIYSSDFIEENLKNLSNPKNNRKGILLSNEDTEKIGVNTITPNLWCLYNELPPNTVQKPHRHNSVALDLCIFCEDSENIYTLVGEELEETGEIKNPKKIHWKRGEMFITPPGLWHSHNNVGNTFAYILPIQDAGLLLFQRILGIELFK